MLVADVSDETNLLSGDIGPIFSRLLFNLQQLMRNTKRVELLSELTSVPGVILVRGVERTDNNITRAHLKKFTIRYFRPLISPAQKPIPQL